MTARRAWLLPTLFAAGLLVAGQAAAQGLGLGNAGSDQPLEVLADDGIEWRQNDNVYVARGNARARQGEVTVYGDTLFAHYRKGAAGATEVWKVEAVGNVRIASPTETAYGERAVYTIDDALLVMTGKNLRLVTPRETITARDRLEYWDRKNLAVARGNAVAITEERRIAADTLTATFKEGGAATPAKPPPVRPAANASRAAPTPTGAAGARVGDSRLERMDAVGNVVITTPDEIVRGERGVYVQDSGIATLTGSVKITRGANQLNGEAAEVNLRTGVSRLVSARPGASGGPVRALIVPERQEGGAPAAPTPTGPRPPAR